MFTSRIEGSVTVAPSSSDPNRRVAPAAMLTPTRSCAPSSQV
jgi:hypothetical protein